MSRYTEQDVAALYCAMRDGICDVQAQSWRMRLLDFLFPERAAKRRAAAIEVVYREWLAAREVKPTHDEPLQERMPEGTMLGLAMVKAALKRKADEYDRSVAGAP